MPFVRGREPTRNAAVVPVNASSRSVVTVTDWSSGKAASASSMATPVAACFAGSISSNTKSTGTSLPKTSPEATRKARA